MSKKVNGIVLNEQISENLYKLQDGYADALACEIDEAISFLLENRSMLVEDSNELLNILGTLHCARVEFLGLIPQREKGGDNE